MDADCRGVIFNNKIRSIVRTLLVLRGEMELAGLISFINENHKYFKLGQRRGITTMKLRSILVDKNNKADIIINRDSKIVSFKNK